MSMELSLNRAVPEGQKLDIKGAFLASALANKDARECQISDSPFQAVTSCSREGDLELRHIHRT